MQVPKADKSGFKENKTDLLPQSDVQKEGRSLADALPDLLIEARNVASTVAFGWHGRRRAGPGETFWQFRPFNAGEPMKRVDWRRSARDDHLYVREREWEAAHTVWLWSDLSRSMNFGSTLADASKRDRAIVIMLGLAELLSRSGERIGLPGLMPPTTSRNGAEKLAQALIHADETTALPDSRAVKRFSDIVLFADLLDPIDDIRAWISTVASTGAGGHLVQILDPVEETFPFGGRTEFEDPETGAKLITGRAQDWRSAYRGKMFERHEALRAISRKAGWTYIVHHTDRPAVEPLLALHNRLSGGETVQNTATGELQ